MLFSFFRVSPADAPRALVGAPVGGAARLDLRRDVGGNDGLRAWGCSRRVDFLCLACSQVALAAHFADSGAKFGFVDVAATVEAAHVILVPALT